MYHYMSNLDSVANIEYDKRYYTVVILTHLGNEIPILLDRLIYKIIKQFGYHWYVNDKNHVYAIRPYIYKNEHREEYIYIHDMVMRLGNLGILNMLNTSQRKNSTSEIIKYMRSALLLSGDTDIKYPIIHINRVHFDNRYANLQYDIPGKVCAKNTKKKKRTIDLEKYGISVQELPTYVWYLKPDRSHGGRFCVEIPNEISWRSTSSKQLSLRFKLEEVKKYLRFLKRQRPDIFDQFCMNGDLSRSGKILIEEYGKMIEKVGYTIPISVINRTDQFIKKDLSDLTSEEIYILYSIDYLTEGTVNVNKQIKEFHNVVDVVTM